LLKSNGLIVVVKGKNPFKHVRTSRSLLTVCSDPLDLHLSIPEPPADVPFVSVPEYSDIRRPDIVSAQRGFSHIIPVEELRRGQVVVTSHTNLRQGRWLKGTYLTNLDVCTSFATPFGLRQQYLLSTLNPPNPPH